MSTRILYVHHAPMLGGAAASLLSLLRHLPEDRVTPILASPCGGFLEQAGAAGKAEVHEIPQWRPRWAINPQRLIGQYRCFRRLATAIRDVAMACEPDLVHANTWPAAVACLRAVGDSIPVIWHVRDLQLRRVVTSRLRGRCAAQIAISRAARDHLLDIGFAPEGVHLVYNGIDVEEFRAGRSAAEVRAELGVPAEAGLVLNVGQFVPWKRHKLLIEAARIVVNELPAAQFVLVGEESRHDAEYASMLRARVSELALERHVHFAGYREDVADLMNACDVYAHAADAEPLGRVILEAMALGKAIVAPNVAGPGELIEDNVSGLAVTPGSAEALARGIIRMLTDPELAEACGRGARRRVEEEFSAQAMVEGTLGVYDRVLGVGQ